MEWNLEIVEDWDIIWSDDYQARWLQLMDKSANAHVFFHPAIVRAWVETYLPLRNIKPIFIWGTSVENEVFFPLILWKRNWKNAFLRTIVPAGFSDFDYHDPIFKNTIKIDSFWEELVLSLKRFSFDRVEFDGLHTIPNQYQCIKQELCPYINLSLFSSSSEFEDSIKPKVIKELKRHEARLSEFGDVSIRLFNKENMEEAIETLPQMLHIHHARFPKAYIAPYFHHNLIKYGLDNGLLYYSEILLNGVAVSWIICFDYKNKRYFYLPTFNNTYKNCSLGKIHLLKSIQDAINNHYTGFDFLRGVEEYKKLWNSEENTINTVRYSDAKCVARFKMFLLNMKYKIL